MPIVYKVKVMEKLKDAGYTTQQLRKDHGIGESAMTKIRNGDMVSLDILRRICYLLNCDISDILIYQYDEMDVR